MTHQITNEDRQILLFTDPMDDIQKLQPVLGDLTVAILRKYGTEYVQDLIKFEPIQFAKIDDLDADEREKLEEVYFHLFRNAYENLHG